MPQQGRFKVGEKAALPPDVRKASGFPAQTASLLPLGSALFYPPEGVLLPPRPPVVAEDFGSDSVCRSASQFGLNAI